MIRVASKSTQDTFSSISAAVMPLLFAAGSASPAHFSSLPARAHEKDSGLTSYSSTIIGQSSIAEMLVSNQYHIYAASATHLKAGSLDLEDELSGLFRELSGRQKPLDEDVDRLLQENLWDLYTEV